MKRIYLSILSLALIVGANAQQSSSQQSKDITTKNYVNSSNSMHSQPVPEVNFERATVLWSDDFSTPANWVMTNSSAPISWNWTITTNQADIPNAAAVLQPFLSATAANGFALINSDGQPGNVDGDGAIVAQITNVTPINLTGYPNVILRFSHSYRWWHDTRGVRVSGNNGATWTDFDITSDVGGSIPNGYPNDQNSENPVIEAINISAVAGGQDSVLVQFYYNDNNIWAWYWTVDDVEILEQPANDIQLLSGWCVGTNNEGVEYGRTPANHLDASYVVGAEVYNFGTSNQTNVVFDANFTSFSSAGTDPLLEVDSTTYIQQTETPSLPIGVYNGTYTVVSDLDTIGGAESANNVYQRNFEVTNDIYSQDGIGVHPVAELNVGAIGTGNFGATSDDGLVLAAMYHIKVTDDVVNIVVMLDPATVAGGTIDGSIKDTATFRSGDMISLFNAPSVTVTAADILNGYATLVFPANSTLAPGAYYAAVELYSNAGANDIWVLDDRTIPQPAWASAIFIAADQSYTNGDAFAIRLTTAGADAGINEGSLVDVSVYPNPASDVVSVNFDIEQYHNASVQMVNISGQAVYSSVLSTQNHKIDLANISAGVYFVKIMADEGNMVRKVVVSK